MHTYLHHVERLDHRHNFSPYNILLYLTSPPSMGDPSFPYASVAFLPQLFLSGVLLPLAFAKWDLPTTLFAQTFAFVAFNKVCTSQVCSYRFINPTTLLTSCVSISCGTSSFSHSTSPPPRCSGIPK